MSPLCRYRGLVGGGFLGICRAASARVVAGGAMRADRRIQRWQVSLTSRFVDIEIELNFRGRPLDRIR